MAGKQIFDGVKCADFSWVAAGPQVSRTLAEHGATVVRVENHRRPEAIRVSAPFKDFKPGIDTSALSASYNANKYGISLDLAKPTGREIARKLIEWADIVCESFSPGIMKKLGLDYEEARKIKPDIIYFSTNMQGQYGPHALAKGLGHHAAALTGFSELTGFPDGKATLGWMAYVDYVAPWYMVVSVAGALDRRRKTGKGMYLDQTQLEVGPTFLAPAILDYTVNGRIMKRMGNRDPHAAPHGAYRCLGDDRWVVITVFTDGEWKGFCEAIGNPEWVGDEKFTTLVARKGNEDELDSLVEGWTIQHTGEQVVRLMQANGVPAGMVYKAEDLFNDPQLKHREHFVYLEHQAIGRHAYHSEAIRFSKTPQRLWKAAPCLGEDNEYVYKEFLGFSDDDISDLIVEGVITTEADVGGLSG